MMINIFKEKNILVRSVLSNTELIFLVMNLIYYLEIFNFFSNILQRMEELQFLIKIKADPELFDLFQQFFHSFSEFDKILKMKKAHKRLVDSSKKLRLFDQKNEEIKNMSYILHSTYFNCLLIGLPKKMKLEKYQILYEILKNSGEINIEDKWIVVKIVLFIEKIMKDLLNEIPFNLRKGTVMISNYETEFILSKYEGNFQIIINYQDCSQERKITLLMDLLATILNLMGNEELLNENYLRLYGFDNIEQKKCLFKLFIKLSDLLDVIPETKSVIMTKKLISLFIKEINRDLCLIFEKSNEKPFKSIKYNCEIIKEQLELIEFSLIASKFSDLSNMKKSLDYILHILKKNQDKKVLEKIEEYIFNLQNYNLSKNYYGSNILELLIIIFERITNIYDKKNKHKMKYISIESKIKQIFLDKNKNEEKKCIEMKFFQEDKSIIEEIILSPKYFYLVFDKICQISEDGSKIFTKNCVGKFNITI